MEMKKLPSAGRLYAYVGAIGGFALSFWANVRDAYIPEIPKGVAGDLWRAGYPGYHNVDPNGFDLVLAGFFPIALFVALELLTRVDWKPTNAHKALKWLGVGGLTLVAGIISYSHLRTGFILAGWSTSMASLAPFAVDGFMLLCTTVLLMTGHPTDLSTLAQEIHHQSPSTPAQEMAQDPARQGAQLAEQVTLSTPGQNATEILSTPASEQGAHGETAAQRPSTPAEHPAQESMVDPARDMPEHPAPSRPRAPRKAAPKKAPSTPASSSPEQAARAAAAVLSGELSQVKAAEKFGVSRAAVQRAMRAKKQSAEQVPETELEGVDLSADLDAELAEILGRKNDDET